MPSLSRRKERISQRGRRRGAESGPLQARAPSVPGHDFPATSQRETQHLACTLEMLSKYLLNEL